MSDNVPQSEKIECAGSERIEFLWRTHSYTNEYIRFADTKAAIVVAWTSAFLGVLYSGNVHHFFRPDRLAWATARPLPSACGILGLFAFLFLAAGFVIAVRGMLPHLECRVGERRRFFGMLTGTSPAAGTGIIYWNEVLAHGSEGSFSDAVRIRTPDGLADDVARHVFVLASISRRKFELVNLSVWFALIGSVFAAVVALLAK